MIKKKSFHILQQKKNPPNFHFQTTKLLTDPRIEHIPRREAEESEILAVHTKRYVDDVKSTETMTVVRILAGKNWKKIVH